MVLAFSPIGDDFREGLECSHRLLTAAQLTGSYHGRRTLSKVLQILS